MELEKRNGIERRKARSRDPEYNPEDYRPLDLRPEFCHYQDEGCELAESCLNCPFEECIYEPGGKRRRAAGIRNQEMVRQHLENGKTAHELVKIFGLSLRTIQRILKRAEDKNKQEMKDK